MLCRQSLANKLC